MIITSIYLLCAVLFILALRGLSAIRSASRGNTLAIIGISIAILATFAKFSFNTKTLLTVGVITVGGIIGYLIANKVKMKDLPQLIAAFHSLIGLVAVCTDATILARHSEIIAFSQKIEIALGVAIGAITFSGSLVAFLKLQGITKNSFIKRISIINIFMCIALLMSILLFFVFTNILTFGTIILLATMFGYSMIIPIGGADMPVIVSMLNSYSGWATAGIGFTINSQLLIITGALVGTSGAILSYIMCKGMNRKLSQVVLVGFRENQHVINSTYKTAENVKLCNTEDVSYMLENASSIVIVPGYGMAVAQAQHAVKDLIDKLFTHNVTVKFAIHPVAGRMPGHMNVLLAEANISDDYVYELEDINNEFSATDIVIVVGANDITNPSAKDEPTSPIYGMPILEVWKAKTVIVIKRSLNAGYAGIDNPLFYKPNTLMLLGDAKKVLNNIVKFL